MTFAQTLCDARRDLHRRATLDWCADAIVLALMASAAAFIVVVVTGMTMMAIAAHAMQAW